MEKCDQTLSQLMTGLHQSGSVNLDVTLRTLLESPLVPATEVPVDIFIGHQLIFITAPDAIPSLATLSGETGRPPHGSFTVAGFEEMSKLGLIKLDSTLRMLVDQNGAGAREVSDHWALLLHHQYVLLHLPDQSGASLSAEDAPSIASSLDG